MLSEAEKNKLRRQRDLDQAVRDAILDAAGSLVDDELEVDPDAVISAGEDGAWVQAWVWIEEGEVSLPNELFDEQEQAYEWPQECANPVTAQELQQALSALYKRFQITYGRGFHKVPAAREAGILLARMKGIDPIEDQTCYLRDDL